LALRAPNSLPYSTQSAHRRLQAADTRETYICRHAVLTRGRVAREPVKVGATIVTVVRRKPSIWRETPASGERVRADTHIASQANASSLGTNTASKSLSPATCKLVSPAARRQIDNRDGSCDRLSPRWYFVC
jgi:hypothetical protein